MSLCIPAPTGPCPVSCCDILDKIGIDGTFFRIYYPTITFDVKDAQFPTWMEPEYFKELRLCMGEMNSFPIAVPSNLLLEIPSNVEKLPVLLFSHGFHLSKDAYSFICSDLASYGFLVAAVDHKDGSSTGSYYMEKRYSGGHLEKKSFQTHYDEFGTSLEFGINIRKEQVAIRVKELSKVMDCLTKLNKGKLVNRFHQNLDLSNFKGKILLERAAVIGHSHGGTAAIVSLLKDDRFKAAVTLDPWMLPFEQKYAKQRVKKPIIFINSIGGIAKEDILRLRQLDGDVTGTTAERIMITLLGTNQFTHTDFAFFPDSFFRTNNLETQKDAKLSNIINTTIILRFLRQHFSLPGDQDISATISKYPEYAIFGSDIKVTEEEVAEAKRVITPM